MHKNGYFYILRNHTLTNNRNDQMKRDRQEIQRLKRALKGRSLQIAFEMLQASGPRRSRIYLITRKIPYRETYSKVTRHNNGVYREMVEKFKTENATQAAILRHGVESTKILIYSPSFLFY